MSKFPDQRGKTQVKKIVSARKRDLPDENTPVIIADVELLEGYELLNSLFLRVVKGELVLNRENLKQNLTVEQIRLLDKVSKDVRKE